MEERAGERRGRPSPRSSPHSCVVERGRRKARDKNLRVLRRFRKILTDCKSALLECGPLPQADSLNPRPTQERLAYTLNLNSSTSPSRTTYSLPSMRYSPFSRAAAMEP